MSLLLKISILARFLEKTDFGLMAIIMSVISFSDMFMDLGLGTAIIHKQNISKSQYSSLYWINIGFSLLLFAIIYSIAPLLAKFYDESDLIVLLPIMGSGLIITAIGRQFKTIEQKKLNFKFISIIEIIGSLSTLVAAVVLAIMGYGVYSLVYSTLLRYFLINVAYFFAGMKKQGLLFKISFRESVPFLKIGIFQVGQQTIGYFNRDLDVLIIGKFFGAEILGGYSLAKQLVFRPIKIINPILTRVAAPVLAKFQYDKALLSKNYLKLVNMVSTINTPIYLFIIIFASFIVHIFYGKEFDDIVALVQILSISMIFKAIGNPVGSLVIATGKTALHFFWGLITLIIIPLAIVIGSQYSIEWVAASITITMILLFIPNWWFLINRMINVDLPTYLYWTIPGLALIQSGTLNRHALLGKINKFSR